MPGISGWVVWAMVAFTAPETAGRNAQTQAEQVFEAALRSFQSGRPAEAEEQLRRLLLTLPDHPQALNLLGAIYDQQGKPAEAAAFFQHALRVCPGCLPFYNNLALNYLRRGLLDESVHTFKELLRRDPSNLPARFNLGTILLQAGRAEAALEHLQQARRLAPADKGVQFRLAEALAQTGRASEALATIDSMGSPERESPPLLNLAGTVLLRLNRPEEAVGRLSRAAEAEPANPDHHYKLSLAYQKQGRVEAARQAIEAAIGMAAPVPADYYLTQASLELSLGRRAEAEEAALQASRLGPASNTSQFALALLLRDLGRLEEAIGWLERLQAGAPTPLIQLNLALSYHLAGRSAEAASLLDGQPEPTADSLQLLAKVRARLAHWELGVRALERALELQPDNAGLYFDLGLLLLNSGALAQAESLFEQTLTHFPDSAVLRVGLAQAQIMRDRYSEAQIHLLKAIQLDPSYAEAHYLLGHSYHETDRPAIENYRRAVSLDPGRTDFRLSLAIALEKEGKEEEAMTELDSVIRMDPQSEAAHYRMGRILARRGDDLQALEYLNRSISLGHRDPQTFYQLSGLYRRLDRPEEAEKALQTFQELKAQADTQPAVDTEWVKDPQYYLRFLQDRAR